VRAADQRQPGSWELAGEPDDLSGPAVTGNFPEGAFFRGVSLSQSGAVILQSGKLGREEGQRPQADRQRERAYVIPKTVRNAATKRTRTAFGALSKAYSTLLTREQQKAWNAAAAKVLSRPRLGQCGPLSGQEHFVGINSSRARIDRDWLPWPPASVVFGQNPVEALSLRYVAGRLRVELSLSGPVAEDIMVFAQAPCSPGWKRWRHGTCLGLLPVPQNGVSDITEMYLEAFWGARTWPEGLYPHPAAAQWLGRRSQGR
jgi:hypothetical protein